MVGRIFIRLLQIELLSYSSLHQFVWVLVVILHGLEEFEVFLAFFALTLSMMTFCSSYHLRTFVISAAQSLDVLEELRIAEFV